MVVLLKALSDPLRLRLLDVLSRGELTVQDLTSILSLGQSKVSHHLKILCEAGVLAVKPQGTWNYYRIVEENSLFCAIWSELSSRFESLPEHRVDISALSSFWEQRRRQNLEFFEQHAQDWDVLAENVLPTPDYLPSLINLVPTGSDVAELGIGTGGLMLELADRCSRLVGIDHSSAMLAETKRRLAAVGRSCDLRLGEFAHLPLADSELDVVLMNMVLHHVQQPGEVLQEAHRVLKPGGEIIIADLKRHQHDAVRSSMADIWLGFEESELSSWLTEAGFFVDRIETLHGKPGDYTVLLVVART
jgi:ArsR family transcriptional regulator